MQTTLLDLEEQEDEEMIKDKKRKPKKEEIR